ncbi:GGDEF domain-containing protein [Cellulomonas triticagri]|uniref:GGDEF domain-containing protein n=2 Tax=Cellulomonas triticagri TaxID=2483352 RepID=A0A3M2JC58_9CELL|nr:GGDEF domain-containing protein [Cellulomonas triticagri]
MSAVRADEPRARDRAMEDPVAVRVLARVPAWARAGGNASAAGRVLLMFCCLVMVIGAICLGVDGHAAWMLGGTAAAMLAATGISLWYPWRRSPRGTMLYPLGVIVALGVLALTTTGIAAAFVGLIPLCFVFVGLFHHGRAALALLPVTWATYLAIVPVFDVGSWIRVGIYGITWYAIAQVISMSMQYQRTLRRRLFSDARTDALTSLNNRRALEERLATAVPGDCVVIADLDHFKCVNDTQGHAAGDLVLEKFGHTLAQHLRMRDYAARYGGEEFVLILPRTETVQAMNMLRALRTEWNETGVGVTFSAGIALITEASPPGSALARADVALYRAKQAGRDRFRIASDAVATRRVTDSIAEGAAATTPAEHLRRHLGARATEDRRGVERREGDRRVQERRDREDVVAEGCDAAR